MKFVFAVLAAMALALSACGPPQQVVNPDDDQIVGRPPAADDPYFFVAMPAEARPTAHSGTLGLDEPAEIPEPSAPTQQLDPQVDPQVQLERQERLERQAQQDQLERQARLQREAEEDRLARQERLEREAQEDRRERQARLESQAKLDNQARPEHQEPASPPKVQPPSQPGCYSCVRICAIENSAVDCSDAPEDLVCGWGTHADTAQAKILAQAQCDATLDMARQMPMYSRIEGSCPPASCDP